jgi:hypothetical protein
MPPSFLIFGRVDRLLALELRAFEDTVSLLVALEANSLLLVSFTLMMSPAMALKSMWQVFGKDRPRPPRLALHDHDLDQAQILPLDEVVCYPQPLVSQKNAS